MPTETIDTNHHSYVVCYQMKYCAFSCYFLPSPVCCTKSVNHLTLPFSAEAYFYMNLKITINIKHRTGNDTLKMPALSQL